VFCFFTREQTVADSVLALDFLLKLRRIDGMKPGGLYNLSLSAYSQAKPASILTHGQHFIFWRRVKDVTTCGLLSYISSH